MKPELQLWPYSRMDFNFEYDLKLYELVCPCVKWIWWIASYRKKYWIKLGFLYYPDPVCNRILYIVYFRIACRRRQQTGNAFLIKFESRIGGLRTFILFTWGSISKFSGFSSISLNFFSLFVFCGKVLNVKSLIINKGEQIQ